MITALKRKHVGYLIKKVLYVVLYLDVPCCLF